MQSKTLMMQPVVLSLFLLCQILPQTQAQDQTSEVITRRKGERYAILVGVQNYDKSSGLRSLVYTDNDVTELAELLYQAGYLPENIVLMTDTSALKNPRFSPERSKVLQEVDNLLRDKSTSDSVLIAFAGHGVQFKGDDDNFFCPRDAIVDNRDTLVSMTDVYRRLNECKARTKLLFSDACRNDPLLAASRGLQIIDDSVSTPAPPEKGIAAFYSCSKDQAAYEDASLRHGVFFHFLIAGLCGDADFNGDGGIQLPELELYTKRRVSDYVRDQFGGNSQLPNLQGNTEGLLTLIETKAFALPKPKKFADLARLHRGGILVNSIGMKFALIPGGDGWMGHGSLHGLLDGGIANSAPLHPVVLSNPYFIGTHEVTQKQYSSIVKSSPSTVRDADTDLLIEKNNRLPVSQVSWDDAVDFCKLLSANAEERHAGRTYRLPTEAEWEFACRGISAADRLSVLLRRASERSNGNERDIPERLQEEIMWYFGGDNFLLDEHAWYLDTSGGECHEIEGKKENPFGLKDTYGNVREWCVDWYGYSYFESHNHYMRDGLDRIQQLGRGFTLSEYACLSPFALHSATSREAIGGGNRFYVIPDPKGPDDATVIKKEKEWDGLGRDAGKEIYWGHRVVKGGSWADRYDDCRSDSRTHLHPSIKDDQTGFRVICEIVGGDGVLNSAVGN
jgi:formylglycine-generating enzyme required for sulfatase activity